MGPEVSKENKTIVIDLLEPRLLGCRKKVTVIKIEQGATAERREEAAGVDDMNWVSRRSISIHAQPRGAQPIICYISFIHTQDMLGTGEKQ